MMSLDERVEPAGFSQNGTKMLVKASLGSLVGISYGMYAANSPLEYVAAYFIGGAIGGLLPFTREMFDTKSPKS